MHFKNLQLFGFKSFAEKTDLDFEPGVTAIVGPNGCGKSNIADAIKWVLGENSARELRGLRMEDVIFNGTDGKDALGFAEVCLTVSNQPKILPSEYDEVTISRRVFRSGESEFFINKAPVRLKDITELLMGTGIGTTTYSLMEQGKIDQILDSRPEERRYVFEEAAGITKYKSKKKEALRKLEQTETNLLRINDVITEVKRQINSIERQANKARRYKEEFEKLKELEVLAASYQYRKVNEDEGIILSDKDTLMAKENELTSQMNGFNSRLDSLRKDLSRVDQLLSDVKANAVNIEGQIQRNNDKALYNSERISELNSRIANLEREIEANKLRVSNLEEEVNILNTESNSFKTTEENKRTELDKKTKYLDTIAEVIKTSQVNIEGAKTYVVDVAQGQARVRNEITKSITNIQNLSARRRRIEVEKRKVDEEKEACNLKSKEMVGILESISKNIEGLNWKNAQTAGDLSTLEEEVLNYETQIQSVNTESTTARSKLEFLEDLKARYEGFSLGVKSVLKEVEKGSSVCEGVIGILADLVEPVQGYEAVVEAALGDGVQAMIVKNREVAKRLMKFLGDNSLGRAAFISLDDLPKGGRKSDILNYIKAGEGVRPALEYLLSNAYLAEDLESAFNTIRKKDANAKFVTKSGEVVERGLAIGGKIPRVEGFSLIGRDAKIKELEFQIEAFNKKFEVLNKEVHEKKERRDALQLEAKSIADEINRVQIEHANRMSEKSGMEEIIRKLDEEESLLNLEFDEVKSEIENTTAKEEELKRELASLDDEDTKVQETIKANQETISLKTSEREEILVQMTQLKTELDLLKDKEGSVLKALNMMGRSLDDERNGLVTREKEVAESKGRILELKSESEELTKLNESLSVNKAGVKEGSQKASSERTSIADSILQLEAQLKDRQKGLDELREQINSLNVKSMEFNYKKSNLKDRLLQVYKVELDLEQVLMPEGINWEETNGKIEALRSKLEQMGPVNLVAIEEHQELQERYNFLTTHHQDLLNAKEDLHKAINKINRTTRELFIETFQKIQVEFRDMFRLLFGGGDAELLLIDQSDILESGIEIIARPPGKKPQSISLLSGGERSLTAIALLFAIFKVKPSPFCVLDEIDAALDEANIDRFCRVLKEFVKDSQFIIITHSKKTISIADVMYGITMEESGVSKIVSVKFAEAIEAKTA